MEQVPEGSRSLGVAPASAHSLGHPQPFRAKGGGGKGGEEGTGQGQGAPGSATFLSFPTSITLCDPTGINLL